MNSTYADIAVRTVLPPETYQMARPSPMTEPIAIDTTASSRLRTSPSHKRSKCRQIKLKLR